MNHLQKILIVIMLQFHKIVIKDDEEINQGDIIMRVEVESPMSNCQNQFSKSPN